MDRILYLDDEPANLSAFKASFRHDFEIITEGDPEKALDLCEKEEFKIVISDQKMPSISGSDFFHRLLEIDPKPIRLLITAFSDPNSLKEAVNKGQIYFYIQKPFDHEEMKALLLRAINEYEMRERKQELEVKSERMEKEKVRAVLHNLKNQVNPHFLFNSLNMLHALIGKDIEKSREYVIHLSEFLRKTLEFRDMDTSSVKEELDLLSSYLFIQKIRFGEAFKFENQIDQKYLDKEVPVLAMQICIENAIKHNAMSKDDPLEIKVKSTESGISISNSIKPREGSAPSTGLGQENLISRYRLFGGELPIFGAREGVYRSWLPFLNQD